MGSYSVNVKINCSKLADNIESSLEQTLSGSLLKVDAKYNWDTDDRRSPVTKITVKVPSYQKKLNNA
ncbi:hypothetical protein JTE90_026508 [Oedothorax gibbosus]|uniref:Uncharacterized protein n=1 Tax=Oedothorax gibbosus TaxID=931172 RepID=A0AAV6VSW8_9ARAC|nr:hypothetical protein JTE90_026508 [Oedothorax gibbosus]